MSSADRDPVLLKTLGPKLFARVRAAKVLVVGAGGIGCELLKNLATSGFTDVETIDLDTIDVSNLNRQFLFRKVHVGKSKARVAKEAVMRFNPKIKMLAHHGNIKQEQFGVRYFQRFTIVMNALDNLSARKHVNRLCLAAKVPLIEAGSTGDLGQATVIKKGVTECYECQPKATPKKYPICTIRSTPSKPVHCIVWAKELFKLIFGDAKESLLWEDDVFESTYMQAVQQHPPTPHAEGALSSYARRVCSAIFGAEIVKKIKMDKYKGAETPPKPLDLELLLTGAPAEATWPAMLKTAMTSFEEQRRMWDAPTTAVLLLQTIRKIWETRAAAIGELDWSKDDPLGLCFVVCASNLRSLTFNIATETSFKVKEIAGNIIPAIATTNAIVAGLQVLEAFKIFRSFDAPDPDAYLKSQCKQVWVNMRSKSRKGHVLTPSQLEGPSKGCYVCRNTTMFLRIDTKKTTFDHFLTAVVKGRLAFNCPTIDSNKGTIYEEGEGADDFSAHLRKRLCDLPAGGLKDGTMLVIDDFLQEYQLSIVVEHAEESSFDKDKTPELFTVSSKASAPAPAAVAPAAAAAAAAASEKEPGLEIRGSQKRAPASDLQPDATAADAKRARVTSSLS